MARKSRWILLSLALSLSTSAYAASDPWGDSPFTLQLGAFWANAETKLHLDSVTLGRGTTLSLESDLGLSDSKTLPEFSFLWRMNPRHGIEGSYVSLHRDGTRTYNGQIQFGDVVFPVNASVNATFDSDVFRVAYRYSPINENGNELSLLLGLHYTSFDTTLATTIGSISESASVNFPLPTIGARGRVKIADDWRLTGFAQLLKLKVGDYDGKLINMNAGVEWLFMRQAYAGLSYNYYKYNLTSEKNNARGEFNFRFDGPMLYVGYAFR